MSRAAVVSASCDTEVQVTAGTVMESPGSKLPRFGGNYLGMSRLGNVASPPTEIRLSIEVEGASRFAGRLRSIGQGSQPVAGVIANSRHCQFIADSAEAQANVRLDWQDHGGGAAILTGEVSERGRSTAAALLRPFENPAIDWSRLTGRYPATFTSCHGRQMTEAYCDVFAGAAGIFQARIPGSTERRSSAVVIGATNLGGSLIVVGLAADPSQIITLTGIVRTDWDNVPVALAGHYLLETSAGQLLDVGRFHIALQR